MALSSGHCCGSFQRAFVLAGSPVRRCRFPYRPPCDDVEPLPDGRRDHSRGAAIYGVGHHGRYTAERQSP